eukprot:Em0019g330a
MQIVQRQTIFNDSKEYVDRPLKADPSTIIQAFSNLPDNSSSTLKSFVLNWTSDAGTDLQFWVPPDWVQTPAFVTSIKTPALRQWATELNSLWRNLSRRVDPVVAMEPDRHSLLYVPNPFIVPGGRFIEQYYWDSYWVLHGLLLGQMMDTSRGMIENFAHLIDMYGLVPNGGRAYYTLRSQPPLLTQMVHLYYSQTNNVTFLQNMLPRLDKEYSFWMTNRTVDIRGHLLNQYSSPTNGPRPESYREDMATASLVSKALQPQLFSNLASAAESGWDFSTRWLNTTSSAIPESLASIRTKSIIPVDLNSILCANEATLALLHQAVGNATAASKYQMALLNRQQAFEAVFWNETAGLWLDLDQDTDKHLEAFYLSSMVTLLWGCSASLNVTRHELVLKMLQNNKVLEFPGGMPVSLKQSSQQWDFPNVWAPLQWFLVAGWYNSTSTPLRAAARTVAQTWIDSTYTAWNKFNLMFEKYNCTGVGVPGDQGEYTVQAGFGWSNGVTLHFLSLYPDMKTPSSSQSNQQWVDTVALLGAGTTGAVSGIRCRRPPFSINSTTRVL